MFQTGGADLVRSRRLLQRCLHGRSVRMLPKAVDIMVGAGTEVEGAVTTTTPTAAAEAMRREGEEEGAEGGRCRVAGGTAVEEEEEEGEAVTTRVTIKTLEVIMGVEGEVGIEEEEGTTKEASRSQVTMEVAGVTMTTTTKTEAGIRTEAGPEEAEDAEDEEDKGEAGEGEEARVLTKEDSLNSSFNMADSTTTRPASPTAGTTPAEHSTPCKSTMPYQTTFYRQHASTFGQRYQILKSCLYSPVETVLPRTAGHVCFFLPSLFILPPKY